MARKFVKPETLDTIIYHSPCMDGMASAFVAYKFNPNFNFIGWDLNDTSKIANTRNKRIAFIDCAPSPELYSNLEDRNNVVLVIDHHVGNKRNLGGKHGCFFDVTRSGCMLAWDYFFPEKPIPPLLYYIGMRDIWVLDDPITALVGYSLIDDPPMDFRSLDHISVLDLAENGKKILAKIDEKIASLIVQEIKLPDSDETAIAVDVHDYKFISECAHAILKNHPNVPYVIAYYKTRDGNYKLSFRTERDDIDVSLLAKTFGGNGHEKAAGATVDVLPF